MTTIPGATAPPSLVQIAVSDAERERGALTQSHVAEAVRALDADGVVVLQSVVDTAHLDALHQQMLSDLKRILARPDAPFNFNTGNVQQDPPPFPPFLFRDILLNEFILDVTCAVLGPNLKNTFYSGNAALPGGNRQPVHPDVAQLWGNLPHPTPAFGLVVNIPVVDMGPENGATELWPGTHHDTTFSIHQGSARIDESHLARWRDRRPPVQPVVKRGDALIRDIRLWHAGMPNHTQEPRPMLALIHWASWWNANERIRFPRNRSVEDFLQHDRLRTVVEWVAPDELDHTGHNQAYDLRK